MVSLVQYVSESIAPEDYLKPLFEEWGERWDNYQTELRIHCQFHEDKTESLCINRLSGQWQCFGCPERGSSIVNLHSRLEEITIQEAAIDLYSKFIRPIIPDSKVNEWVAALSEYREGLTYVLNNRMLGSEFFSVAHKIGWDGLRFTIPIPDQFGLWVNVRRYNPSKHPKMVNYSPKNDPDGRTFGSPPFLYPLSAIEEARQSGNKLTVCEGEWDALVLLAHGIPGVTSTSGVRSWRSIPREQIELLRGMDIAVAYDNDKDGTKYDKLVFDSLGSTALSVRRIDIPKRFGKDVSDWFEKKKLLRSKPDHWNQIFDSAKILYENTEESVVTVADAITLPESINPEHLNKHNIIRCSVNGKWEQRYQIPQFYRVHCEPCMTTNCEGFHGNAYRERIIDLTDEVILKFTDVSEKERNSLLLAIAGATCKKCRYSLEVLQWATIEVLMGRPTADSQTQGTAEMRHPIYVVGQNIPSNRTYLFHGKTVPHPKDGKEVRVSHKVEPVDDDISNFKLTDEVRKTLEVFQPDNPSSVKSIGKQTELIAQWQSEHITKIVGRPNLHIAMDLVYHSVDRFFFNEQLIKGMLDLLVIGDTRCGKTQCARNLAELYRKGEIVSGENCTYAGMVSATVQFKNSWVNVWGKIPQNHRGMVIFEEISSMPISDIAKLSRIRSEGIAEVTKVISEQTQARTRMLWLSNSRRNRELGAYSSALEAALELIGAPEDLARFHAIIAVQKDEVDPRLINVTRADMSLATDPEQFTQQACRDLIRWVWSREIDQIIFTESATKILLEECLILSSMFSSKIPLVQAESIREKLSGLSAALAGRQFSCDDDGNLLITVPYVRAASDWLQQQYNNPTFGYQEFTARAQSTEVLHEAFANDAFDKNIQSGTDIKGIALAILNGNEMTKEYFLNHATSGEGFMADFFLSKLVRANVLVQNAQSRNYVKTRVGTEYLRKLAKHGLKR